MIDSARIDELSRRVLEALPAGQELERLGDDLRKNLRAALGAAIARMDLVEREEFEVQREVLLRTRERLDALAERVTVLERGGDAPVADNDRD